MLILYPEYYGCFKCIADKCPDTCCAGWEVVVDDRFKSLCLKSSAPAAKKALSKMYTDSDGDLCLKLTGGRCPMLNSDNLCEVYIDMGKDALCDTCKNFPRYTKESDEYIIKGISVSCPEAARLIINGTYNFKLPDFSTVQNPRYRFVFEMYNFIVEKIMSGEFFAYNKDIIDNLSWDFGFEDKLPCAQDYKDAFKSDYNPCDFRIPLSYIYNFSKQIESLTDEWNLYVNEISRVLNIFDDISYCDDTFAIFTQAINMPETKKLTVYFLYKYMWEVIDDNNIALWLKRAHTASCLYCELYCVTGLGEKLNMSDGYKEKSAQIISKEIEHNGNNLELFEDFCENYSLN